MQKSGKFQNEIVAVGVEYGDSVKMSHDGRWRGLRNGDTTGYYQYEINEDPICPKENAPIQTNWEHYSNESTKWVEKPRKRSRAKVSKDYFNLCSLPSDTPQPHVNTTASSSRRFSGTSSFGARWGSQILEEARQPRGSNSARVYVSHSSARDLIEEDPMKRLSVATVFGNIDFDCTEYRA
ncbi:hypothetical protein L3Y34_010570 [Caenorhabditis briggsae]|uniref:Uncharacterized protein n=1 Tax=Caenorhabditis briggsae TaxID=6238 RepID=A0AAE9CTM9_CAEBR|nr:hypothetical protein L3Y34_010570 [Caenorhabditis briggsae]